MIGQKNIQKLLKNFSIVFLFALFFISSANAKADFSQCKNKELQEKIKQVAKEEGVDPDELLSVIAHESKCNYFVIAWNLPGAPQTAKNKFFESLEQAKSFAEELIMTGKYRVDVGIGQINNEANIKRKDWTLDEVLSPKTALNRVAQILKERGWMWYHSNNSFYAKRWRKLALNVLSHIHPDSELSVKTVSEKQGIRFSALIHERKEPSLIVYLGFAPISSINSDEKERLNEVRLTNHSSEASSLIVYKNL